MMRPLIALALALSTACVPPSPPAPQPVYYGYPGYPPSYPPGAPAPAPQPLPFEPPEAAMQFQPLAPDVSLDSLLDATERSATPGGRLVIDAARAMISSGVIVKGSCWDFVEAVYKRADAKKHPKTIFQGKAKGPFASPAILQPGDWVYLVHDGDVVHSTIFVAWSDDGPPNALAANYVGGQREEPGDFREEDLSQVYNVMRLVE